MNHISLATRYRPQRFADVAGQPLAAIALSRAAAENRIAPAYLLSGTRGVGKTTIARIFAKALNCECAPGPEPCNECSQCLHITSGTHIDVAEIDGASNTGVDDVRALRETIGFMPMEGRYKIFIIDEAHMLSKSAFNALLKTLEEPPAHTVFIFATTEAHRFPATIISRCQHFVFRHLSEDAIAEHLERVLAKEGIRFESAAIRIIARRAAGSVRDSLSLLDQALSVSPQEIMAATTRQCLGVAGPELISDLFTGIASQDCATIVNLTSELLASGIDLSFFTRELSSHLRNLFLLRQSGDKILPALHLTQDEEHFLKTQAPAFSLAHLHAAWQLALDSQRTISQSPAPGSALEMLLINMALLPQLLPVGSPQMPQPETGQPKGAPPSNEFIVKEAPKPYASEAPEKNWDGFKAYCAALNKTPDSNHAPSAIILAGIQAIWNPDALQISVSSQTLWERLTAEKTIFENALGQYCNGQPPPIRYIGPRTPPTPEEQRKQAQDKPEIRLCCEILDASVSNFTEKTQKG